MLSPPHDLAEPVLAATLAAEWGLTVASLDYRPLGFGSHHWEVTTSDGGRFFVTVDDLETKRHTRDEPPSLAYDRLRASLTAAQDLRAAGRTFAVAPMPTRAGSPLAPASERFAVAVYPYCEGRSFAWGEFCSPEHRRAVLDLIVGVHAAPPEARRHAALDDFTVPQRDELEAALDPAGTVADCGPYARRTADLLTSHAAALWRLLAAYDTLVATAQTSRAVLTHGEPHPGNTMLTADGWLLIDWDTALVAPPERDLWALADAPLLAAYADATGVTPQPSMMELYRLRWDLADLAVDVARFRRPHSGNLDDDATWDNITQMIAAIPAE